MDDDELKLCGEVGKDARAFVRKYMQLRAYADELNARCIADAANAERYRWLRQDEGTADWDAAGVLELYAGPDYSRKSGESLDAAIDAAMAPKRDGAA